MNSHGIAAKKIAAKAIAVGVGAAIKDVIVDTGDKGVAADDIPVIVSCFATDGIEMNVRVVEEDRIKRSCIVSIDRVYKIRQREIPAI